MRRRARVVRTPLIIALAGALVGALAGALTGLLTTLAVAAPATAAPPPVTFADAAGLHVVSAAPVDGREWALSVSTPALGGRAVRLRILLPADYTAGHAAGRARYPVLYLFHGTSGGADDWIEAGNAEQTTAGLPLIVVMPDAGFDGDGGGWFTNWWDRSTALGPSQWETFHIDELIPFVDANLRTVADRSGRAIAGLSQGGFGAFSYAARHPDLFAVAGSFSGAPDITSDPVIEAGATGVIDATASLLDGVEPDAMFGPHLTDELNWRGHDPARLVTNLAHTSLDLYTATGLPGPLDTGAPNPGAMGIEFMTHLSTLGFADDRQGRRRPVLPGRLRVRHAHLRVLGARPHRVRAAHDGRLRAPGPAAGHGVLPLRRADLDAVGLDGGQPPRRPAGLDVAAAGRRARVHPRRGGLGQRAHAGRLRPALAPPRARQRPGRHVDGHAARGRRRAAAHRGPVEPRPAQRRHGELSSGTAARTRPTRGARSPRSSSTSPAASAEVTIAMIAAISARQAKRPCSVRAPKISVSPSRNCCCSCARRRATSGPAA